jgi:integrase
VSKVTAKIKQFNIVDAWINNVAYSHSKAKNTERDYRRRLQVFCQFIGVTPEQILQDYNSSEERAFKRKYAEYLRAFITSLSQENLTVNTIASDVTAVKSFFRYNDMPLGFVPIARQRISFHNRDIEREEIEKILEVSDPRDRAFFCMMAQSGLRPDILSKLRLKHIEPDFSKGVIPCKITVPEELTKGKYSSYFTFMAEESVDYLQTYLHTRLGINPDSLIFTNHGTENPVNTKSISRIFAKQIQTLRKKGILNYDLRKGKPSELRLYNLRKYFKKHSGQMGSEESEFLMGHTQGVRDHYLAQDPEHYRKLYAEKAMPFLRFKSPTPTETDKVITQQAEKISKLEELFEQVSQSYPLLMRRNEELQRNLDKKSEEMEGLRKTINDILKVLKG